MDIWEQLYNKAKAEYHPEDVTPFVMAHHALRRMQRIPDAVVLQES